MPLMHHKEIVVGWGFGKRSHGELLTTLRSASRVVAGYVGLLAVEVASYEGD